MMIKVLVQEEKTRYTPKDAMTDETTYWQTTDEITSDRKEVVAGFLRALADNLDPPKKVYRGE